MRDSDVADPFRDKTVRLFDDFKISGVNGTRILIHMLDFCSCIQFKELCRVKVTFGELLV